jgi:hypothetical protein
MSCARDLLDFPLVHLLRIGISGFHKRLIVILENSGTWLSDLLKSCQVLGRINNRFG